MNVTIEDDSEFDPYDLNSVLKHNRIPTYSKNKLINWNSARFYSLIDID